ncbi:MAG: DUF1343 domain-containing protein [Deltaproteobacteria bacterium]|jgi:uncharacterized protein YbbC (DUF1343 family)|nr:DUF1343 domain-containing protein [Deltaproteobacteria bacterium]
MIKVLTGLEVFLADNLKERKDQRLGLLANQASIGPKYRHALSYLDEYLPHGITALFNPQHGFAGEKQDNMVESANAVTKDGRPIYSLYGAVREPDPQSLKELDGLIIDLTDVGTRVYTFAQTMGLCLKAAKDNQVEIIVLDRPNPIGGLETEGNLLDSDCASFVGLFPTPMRHGLTLGEMALYINSLLDNPADLTIIPCQNYRRSMYFNDTNLPWVLPSPNMPTFDTAWVYPGQVLWEGTNVSEGRGTTRPFNLMGAPFIDPDLLVAELEIKKLPGVIFRPTYFQPTFHKWAGEVCGGIDLHPLDLSFLPFLTSLTILEIVLKLWPTQFRLKEPPYEYEYDRRPIDLILGRKSLYDRLAKGETAKEVWESMAEDQVKWRKIRREFLLYQD